MHPFSYFLPAGIGYDSYFWGCSSKVSTLKDVASAFALFEFAFAFAFAAAPPAVGVDMSLKRGNEERDA
jgi:hypothetical protein